MEHHAATDSRIQQYKDRLLLEKPLNRFDEAETMHRVLQAALNQRSLLPHIRHYPGRLRVLAPIFKLTYGSIRRVIGWYVEYRVAEQREFNALLIEALLATHKDLSELRRQVDALQRSVSTKNDETPETGPDGSGIVPVPLP